MLIEKLVLDVIFCVIVSGISEIFSSFKKKKKNRDSDLFVWDCTYFIVKGIKAHRKIMSCLVLKIYSFMQISIVPLKVLFYMRI